MNDLKRVPEIIQFCNDVQGTRKMLNQVDICINSSSVADVDLVTPELVYKAAENVKKHKMTLALASILTALKEVRIPFPAFVSDDQMFSHTRTCLSGSSSRYVSTINQEQTR